MAKVSHLFVAVLLAIVPTSSALAQTYGFTFLRIPEGPLGSSTCTDFKNGGAVGDLDRDGFQDIIRCNKSMQILINDGAGGFVDVIATSGITQDYGPMYPLIPYADSASVADYDRDGDLDIYYSNYEDRHPDFQYQTFYSDRLFRNDGGLFFTDVTIEAGLRQENPSSANDGNTRSWGSAWGDYDLDGDLDLAISNDLGSCPSTNSNRLFRNNGDGTFTDVTAIAGLTPGCQGGTARGSSVRFVDMNEDRYPELVWIANNMSSLYFINNGDGTFTEFTQQAGMSQSSTEKGMTVADYNADGLLDIFATNFGTGKMYLNQAHHQFALAPSSATPSSPLFGFGAVSLDFDHDGRTDILAVSQGHPAPYRNLSTQSQLLFAYVLAESGLAEAEGGMGISNFDYDNDGDQDVLVFSCSAPLSLYRSDVSGPNTHWFHVFLNNNNVSDIPPDGIGSVIRIRTGHQWQRGRIDGGNNYMSQSEMSAHFGLGAATNIDELRVEWTNGQITTMTNVAVDQTITIAAPSPSLAGDMNCDTEIDGRDIYGFVLALLSPVDYESQYPICEIQNADFDGNEQLNELDLADFVSLLISS